MFHTFFITSNTACNWSVVV